MDDPAPKRSLADDAVFVESLSDLDRGLSGNEPAVPDATRRLGPRVAPRPTPSPITPPAVAAPITVAAPPPPLAAQSAPTPSAITLPEPPPWLPPSAFGAINAASEALAATFQSDAPSPDAAPPATSRPLLDLFPPAKSRDASAPTVPNREHVSAPPPVGAIEPPRVAVRPRGLPSSSSALRPSGAAYESFYGFDDTPFAATGLRFLYHSAAHDRVLQELLTSVVKHDTVAVLTGSPEIGKTMLCRALVDQLDRRTLVSFVADPVASADDLLKRLLGDFGVISPAEIAAGRLASASRDDLAGALRDFLGSLAALQASALVIIDDAHRLAPAVLRELVGITDVAPAGQLLQIILVGDLSLETHLRSAELHATNERVALRVELEPLQDDEVSGYVAHRLAVAGGGERVDFSEHALRKIIALAGGIPGAVNRICDKALSLGYQASASRIDADFVEEAAQHLGLSAADGRQTLRDRALMAVLMALLMLAGAAGAGWVFREPLGRAISQFSSGRR